jgi:diguanylate cyclase (GGDEF)-like protein
MSSEATLIRLLHLDPPAVLRALRAVASPIYEAAGALGPLLVRHILDVPAVDVTGTSHLRSLWLHSLATAFAARMLAMRSGILAPEKAYLYGLLHDLAEWLECLGRRQQGDVPRGMVSDWIHRWHLQPALGEVLVEAKAMRASGDLVPKPADAATLVCAAEMLAELADFGHPGTFDPAARDLLLSAADRDDFVAAQRLRREVESNLREVGLDLAVPEPDLDLESFDSDESTRSYSARNQGGIAEVVLSLLGCSRAATYLGIITATTSATLRFLGYDRAFFVRYSRQTGSMLVRSKADLSSRRINSTVLQPTQKELASLQECLRRERPGRVEFGPENEPGLLHMIGADEALVVAVNRDFQTPSFLVLDRTLSARPIRLLQEGDTVSTLATTSSLLIENLLHKRRQARAQKFALTDPLTRLFNRRMGLATLDQEIARSARTQQPLTILLLDLDNFKHLNDTHGHVQGDAALRATADVLRRTLRRTDTICRYGGEEFVVILADTRPDEAVLLAARVSSAVELRGLELGLPVTVSIGVTMFKFGDTLEALLHRADQALYASKNQGRNRFSYDDSIA